MLSISPAVSTSAESVHQCQPKRYQQKPWQLAIEFVHRPWMILFPCYSMPYRSTLKASPMSSFGHLEEKGGSCRLTIYFQLIRIMDNRRRFIFRAGRHETACPKLYSAYSICWAIASIMKCNDKMVLSLLICYCARSTREGTSIGFISIPALLYSNKRIYCVNDRGLPR